MKNSQDFWQNLKISAKGGQAIYALAPMAGLTDSAFRQICKGFGADVLYSEMASVTALVYSPDKTLAMLKFNKMERPYIVQLFGSNSKHFIKAVKIISKKIKPDGIDINFGCPVKKVQKQGAGAVLMDDLKLSREIIKSAIVGTVLPISIKIRSQAGRVDASQFLNNVSDLDIKAVMIHGRTLKQGFAGDINWQIIKKARDFFRGVILANGGVNSRDSAIELLKKTEADGIGIARGALGRPWIFENVKCQMSNVKTKEDIFMIAIKHAGLVEKLKGKQGIIEMRKHLCAYASGFLGAGELRKKLVQAKNLTDIKRMLKQND